MKKDKILEEFKEKLRERLRSNLILLKAFGSWARGRAKLYSDIDLLVVVREKKRYFDEIEEIVTNLELEILDKYAIYISSTIYGLREYKFLKSLPTNFMYWVEREGMELWRNSKIKI